MRTGSTRLPTRDGPILLTPGPSLRLIVAERLSYLLSTLEREQREYSRVQH